MDVWPPWTLVEIVVVEITDDMIQAALDRLERDDPVEYALLMEHLPIERRRSE